MLEGQAKHGRIVHQPRKKFNSTQACHEGA